MNTSLLPAQSEFNAPHDPLLVATLELERYAKRLDLEGWVLERLRHCEQETVVNLLLGMEDGRAHSVTGICARHSTARGLPAVAFEVSREAYRNSVCAEAMRMSWLCALFGVSYGGGGAALVVDAEKLSEHELQKVVSGFGTAACELLSHAGVIIPGNVHAVEMDWLEAGLRKRESGGCVKVTGKASTQDAAIRPQEVATGLAEVIRCSAGDLKQRIAVQGFGEEIRALLMLLHRRGARLVAVADESGGLEHKLGLDPAQLVEHVRRQGVLLGYPDGAAVLNADVLETECDVLILAGGSQQVQEPNAAKIRARVVLEVHPGAVTQAAGAVLARESRAVISSLLCAGPRLLSSIEASDGSAPPGRREAWLRRTVRETWRTVAETAQQWELSASEAATALAIQRVAATIRAQENPF